MPARAQASRRTPDVARRVFIRNRRALLLVLVLLVLGAILYSHQAFQYFMYDDEGSYAYAVWRVSEGEVPYRDFLTPQMPLFLYRGGLVVRLFGRSFLPLRVFTMLAALAAGCLLYAINREVLGRPVALVSLGLFLVEANVFHNARFFRPEAFMLLFNLAGMYAFVLGEKRQHVGYLWVASVFFGLSIGTKLFGLLPLAGCALYLLYAYRREGRPLRLVLRQGLALILPALVITLAMSGVTSLVAPYYGTAVLGHHLMQGADLTLAARIVKGLRFYLEVATNHPLVLVLTLLGACLLLKRPKALSSMMVWQVPTVLSLLALSRALSYRHLTYLAPAVATLAAVAVSPFLPGQWRVWFRGSGESPLGRWDPGVVALLLALAAIFPWAKADGIRARWREEDTARLAAWIQEHTTPEELVISDYPGINFAAGRRTTYWAAGLSGGAAQSGQIRGAMLIEEIERENVSMVIINTQGGAHQMVEMVDYPEFRGYVQSHFALVDKFRRGFQTLEIYCRDDTLPLRPDLDFNQEIRLTGARLSATAVPGGSSVYIDTRWRALQKMARDYHVSLRLVDATGHLWAQADDRLMEVFSHHDPAKDIDVRDRFPTSAWLPHQVVLQKHALTVPPWTPSGSYHLVARLYEYESGLALSPGRGSGAILPSGDVVIATIQVSPPPVPPEPDSLPLAVRHKALLAEGLELLGSGPMPQSAKAGTDLKLDLFWRATERPPRDHRLEFRLERGERVLQRWTAHVTDSFPTSSWREGEVVLGHYRLAIDRDLAESDCALTVAVIGDEGSAAGLRCTLATLRIKPATD